MDTDIMNADRFCAAVLTCRPEGEFLDQMVRDGGGRDIQESANGGIMSHSKLKLAAGLFIVLVALTMT